MDEIYIYIYMGLWWPPAASYNCAQVRHHSPAGTFTRVPGRCLRWSPTSQGPRWPPAYRYIKYKKFYVYSDGTHTHTSHIHTHSFSIQVIEMLTWTQDGNETICTWSTLPPAVLLITLGLLYIQVAMGARQRGDIDRPAMQATPATQDTSRYHFRWTKIFTVRMISYLDTSICIDMHGYTVYIIRTHSV